MKTLFAAFCLVAVILVVAIAPMAQLERPETEADIRLCWGPEPKTLDSGRATGVIENRYISSLFEGLVTYDRDDPSKPIPGVAEEWKVSPDRKTYTFIIRQNARWSNGEPVTAHDFYYAWKRILNLEVDCQYIYMLYYIKNAEAFAQSRFVDEVLKGWKIDGPTKGRLKSIDKTLRSGARKKHIARLTEILEKDPEEEVRRALAKVIKEAEKRPDLTVEDLGFKVLDDYVFEVKLENKTPFILDIFAFPTLYPVPKKAIAKHGDNWVKPENIVCNGAFVIDQWKPYYMIILRKNPHYYGADQVRIDSVTCYTVDRPTTALNYYVQGQLDFITKTMIPGDFVETLMERKDFYKYESFSSTFLRLNVTKAPFDNPKVRKAFAMAIDRQEVVAVLRGGEVPASRLVPPIGDYPKYQPHGIAYNPKKAKKLLQEVYPDLSKFPPVEYLYSKTSSKTKDVFDVIKNRLKKNLGVNIDEKKAEWQVYLGRLTRKEYGIASGAWIGDYADANTFIDMWLTGGGNNRTGWGDKEFDKLVGQAAEESDPKERLKILARCEKILLERGVPIIPLYFRVEYFMKKSYVRGVEPNTMDKIMLKYFWVDR